ncbi:MAG: 50S ribosomal protein L4 [Acidimicrobiales bacterium]
MSTVGLRPARKSRPDPIERFAPRRDALGADLGTVVLAPALFGIEPNRAVLHQVVTAQLAGARAGTSSTLTRAQVRGGGSKPHRQKGLGRARQGSIRAPQFQGGGIALGPKPRSYSQRTPRKMVRLALASALSDRAGAGKVVVVDRWPWEAPRTKGALAAIGALGLLGRVLVVLSGDDVVARRSFANLPQVKTIGAQGLNAYEVLLADWVVFTDATLPGRDPERKELSGDG